MTVREWFAKRSGDHVDMPGAGIGAMSFSGRTDSSGRPVIDFSVEDRQIIRLAGHGFSPESIYRTMPAVRICVSFLARNMAQLKLKSYERRDDQAPLYLRDHPLARLLERPNARTTSYRMIEGIVADKAIYDTAYQLKRRVGDQRALFRVPPAFVHPKGGDIFTGPEYYDVNTGRGPIPFPPDQIIDFSGYHALDTRVGTSPMDALRDILAEEVALTRHRQNYWLKAARMWGIIYRGEGKKWSPGGRARFKQSWRNATAGEENAGETAILEDGMTFNPFAFSPKDSEFIAGREFALDLVATEFHIPLAVLSRKDTATFASMKEFHKMLYVDTLGPWAADLEATFGLQLVPEFGSPDLFVEFNIEEKLQGDFETQADAIRSAVQVPWMSVNKALMMRNMEPVGDPTDPDNPYNSPARPANYIYGQIPQRPDQQLSIVQNVDGEAALASEAFNAEIDRILEETKP